MLDKGLDLEHGPDNISAAVRRRPSSDSLSRLLAETQDLVARLVRENRSLKAQNQRLAKRADQLADSWEQIKKLTRTSPRGRNRR